jgi:hypothetical protein
VYDGGWRLNKVNTTIISDLNATPLYENIEHGHRESQPGGEINPGSSDQEVETDLQSLHRPMLSRP